MSDLPSHYDFQLELDQRNANSHVLYANLQTAIRTFEVSREAHLDECDAFKRAAIAYVDNEFRLDSMRKQYTAVLYSQQTQQTQQRPPAPTNRVGESSSQSTRAPQAIPTPAPSGSVTPAPPEGAVQTGQPVANEPGPSAGSSNALGLRFNGDASDVRPPRMRRVDRNSASIQRPAPSPVQPPAWSPVAAPAPVPSPVPVPAPAPASIPTPARVPTPSYRVLSDRLNADEPVQSRAETPWDSQTGPSRSSISRDGRNSREEREEEYVPVPAPAPTRGRRTLEDLLNPLREATPPWGLAPSDPSSTDPSQTGHTQPGASQEEEEAYQSPIYVPGSPISTLSPPPPSPPRVPSCPTDRHLGAEGDAEEEEQVVQGHYRSPIYAPWSPLPSGLSRDPASPSYDAMEVEDIEQTAAKPYQSPTFVPRSLSPAGAEGMWCPPSPTQRNGEPRYRCSFSPTDFSDVEFWPTQTPRFSPVDWSNQMPSHHAPPAQFPTYSSGNYTPLNTIPGAGVLQLQQRRTRCAQDARPYQGNSISSRGHQQPQGQPMSAPLLPPSVFTQPRLRWTPTELEHSTEEDVVNRGKKRARGESGDDSTGSEPPAKKRQTTIPLPAQHSGSSAKTGRGSSQRTNAIAGPSRRRAQPAAARPGNRAGLRSHTRASVGAVEAAQGPADTQIGDGTSGSQQDSQGSGGPQQSNAADKGKGRAKEI